MTQSFFKMFRGGGSQAAVAAPATQPLYRHSSGLLEFHRAIAGREGLSILDLGPTSSSNITLFTGMGHNIYTEDVLQSSVDRIYQRKTEDGKTALDAERFLAENMVYTGRQFDAVLCWDIADYLHESLVKSMVQRFHGVLKPAGVLLAFFHTRDAGSDAPHYRYHIAGKDSLQLQRGAPFRRQRVFNNRHIENLFRDFSSIKFFLARDHVREVLVVR